MSEIVPIQPEESYHAESHAMSVVIPKDRRLVISAPGWLNYAQPGGGYPGSRLVSIYERLDTNGKRSLVLNGFDAEDEAAFVKQLTEEKVQDTTSAVNCYFKHRANLLTVYVNAGPMGVSFAFTNNLEGEKLAYFREYSSRVARGMDEWEKEQQEKQAAEFEEQQKLRRENERLIELGKKAEAENLFDVNRRLNKKFKSMRAELFRIGGKDAVAKFDESLKDDEGKPDEP